MHHLSSIHFGISLEIQPHTSSPVLNTSTRMSHGISTKQNPRSTHVALSPLSLVPLWSAPLAVFTVSYQSLHRSARLRTRASSLTPFSLPSLRWAGSKLTFSERSHSLLPPFSAPPGALVQHHAPPDLITAGICCPALLSSQYPPNLLQKGFLTSTSHSPSPMPLVKLKISLLQGKVQFLPRFCLISDPCPFFLEMFRTH